MINKQENSFLCFFQETVKFSAIYFVKISINLLKSTKANDSKE